jgi:hypothetical protein
MKTPTTVPIAKVVFPITVPATRIQTTSYSRPQKPEMKKKARTRARMKAAILTPGGAIIYADVIFL